MGFTIVWMFPRGPATASQALTIMLATFLVGGFSGFAMRLPLAMVLAPAAYMIAVDLGQLNRVGPTVGPIRLGETFGILALLLGRGFHGLVGVLPIVAGVGVMIADLLAPPSPINIARVRRP
ncbi:MAG: hypothetical protein AAFO06_24920 [Cyanobacteria bacterium J06597_16]